jgi:hypothetical protein
MREHSFFARAKTPTSTSKQLRGTGHAGLVLRLGVRGIWSWREELREMSWLVAVVGGLSMIAATVALVAASAVA